MGEYSLASVLSEHWPVNSAIRCRVRWLGHGPRHLTLHWAEDRTLHFFLGWGCTHSAQFTLGQSGGLSTPGSALLPYGLDVRAGVSLFSIDQLRVDVWQCSTARIATALQCD